MAFLKLMVMVDAGAVLRDGEHSPNVGEAP